MTNHKIDVALTGDSEGERNAFVTFDPTDASAIMELLAKEHVQIVRVYEAMGLCLIRADRSLLMQLAENQTVLRIAASDEPVMLEEPHAEDAPETGTDTSLANAAPQNSAG